MDEEMDPKQESIIDPIAKLINKPYTLSIGILIRTHAIGIENKKGI
tara:strand:- start:179 stop:316 length:138 start_codon:yes stop_codon:yes gene_type:complete